MRLIKTLGTALVFVLLTGTAVNAQCKFDENKKDNFSGEHYRLSSTKIGQRNYNWKVKLEQKGDHYRIGMTIKWGMHVANGIEKGDKFLMLKLENGEIITVEADNLYAATHGGVVGTGQIVSVFEPFGVVDKEVIKKLSQSPIVALKCSFGGVEQELPKIKSGDTGEIMEYAKCLMTE